MADLNDPNSCFKKGAEVEISSNDDGFRGAWYPGTVIRPTRSENKVLVEYKTLTADEAGKKPLRETLDLVQLRPPPPRERKRNFKFSEEVDAHHNDGWWEGVVTEVLDNGRYSVFFRGTREQIEFGEEQLRLHREWVNGKWSPPLEESEGNPKVSLVALIKKVDRDVFLCENAAKANEICKHEKGIIKVSLLVRLKRLTAKSCG
ncbi:unnamed protein product [Ilex paraguariensis]|uniref:Agenet domain-containing protein n=1 Tax=Ilex paraguariensis TaxID=185542 RepID=A0ABC8R4V2_9AQUA